MTTRIVIAACHLVPLSCRTGADDGTATGGVADIASAVADIEQRASKVSAVWSDVEVRFLGAKHQYERAEVAYKLAASGTDGVAQKLEEAEKLFEAARARWQFYQVLVVIAAAVDAGNLARFQAETGNPVRPGIGLL